MLANVPWTKIAVAAAVAFVLRYFLGLGWTWALLAAAAVFFGWLVIGGCPKTDAPAAA